MSRAERVRAGRMQDNEPLMRALSNLICTNTPELVLFVGEALVGNDAVDQLTKFNQRLLDLATSASTKLHAIDGILLTKFDTIDDKVPYISPRFWWRMKYLKPRWARCLLCAFFGLI